MGKFNLKIIIYFLLISLGISIYFQENEASYTILCTVLFLIIFENFLTKRKNIKDNIDFTNSQIYINAFENNVIFAKLNFKFKILHANRQFCQIMHVTKNELKNINMAELINGKTNEIIETLKCNLSWEGTVSFYINNEKIYLEVTLIPINNERNKLKEILFIAKDITELKVSKTNAQNTLYQDSLTKLPNRLKLFTDNNLKSSKDEITYILINIDSFDMINNLYGNDFGDEILKQVARWLSKNTLNKNTKLYKLEADIYAMVCYSKIEESKLKEYLTKISKDILNEKFVHNGTEVDISLTIGASQSIKNHQKLSQIAYKEAKYAKKAFMIYDKNSNKEEEYTKNIQISKLLKNACENDLVIPYFQPILNIQTNQIEKYESLMRIKDSDGSIKTPYDFLDFAKQSKIYPELSKKLIQKSVDTFLVAPSEFSVNLSFLDINNKETKKFILKLLEDSGIGPWIIFELLESEGIENYKEVMKFTEEVKSYGAKIAIDDFGSGYSNFERIVELQVDFLKLDGSLIKNIHQNDDMRIITKTIVNFAKELKIKTVAEFVHSKEVLEVVEELGVDYAQGFYIGKPEETLKV